MDDLILQLVHNPVTTLGGEDRDLLESRQGREQVAERRPITSWPEPGDVRGGP